MKLKILFLFSFVSLYVKDTKAATNIPRSVYAVTWNVGEGGPPASVKLLVGKISDQQEANPDMIIVGLQEVTMNLVKAATNSMLGGKWETDIEELLTSRNDYYKVHSESLQGLFLSVYVKIKYKDEIKETKADTVKTGLGGISPNKGGVILKFKLNNQQYCIVNSHLAAHDDKLDDRIKNYNTIHAKRLEVCHPKSDYVIWLGDLNFRLDEKLNKETILKMVKQRQFDELLKEDQLIVNKKNKKIFQDFEEQNIQFAPTFKLEKGKGTYSSQRRPAWTDRILYKSETGKTITTTSYQSLEIYKESDHFPVYAQFSIQ